jgi:hypothetical protein
MLLLLLGFAEMTALTWLAQHLCLADYFPLDRKEFIGGHHHRGRCRIGGHRSMRTEHHAEIQVTPR